MNGSLSVFTALLKNWFRSKSGVFFSFMFPLMLLLIFGTIFGGGGDQTYTLHVQNRDLDTNGNPTQLSGSLVRALESTGTFNIENVPSGESLEEFVDQYSSFSDLRILIIPENFHQNVMSKNIYVRMGVISDTMRYIMENSGGFIPENQLVEISQWMSYLENRRENMPPENATLIFLSGEGDTSAPVVRGIISNVVSTFNTRLIGAESLAGIATDDLPVEEGGTSGFNAVDYYLPGFIAAFIMANGLMGVTTNTSEFRRNGIIKRLAATPLDKRSWIIGNLLHQVLLALMLTLVMIGVGWAVFGVQAIPGPYALSLIFLGSVVFCGMGLSLGGVIEDIEAANAAGNAIGFPMMFLSGAFFPLEMMPDFMNNIAKMLPLYYFHDGLRKVMIYGSLEGTGLSYAIFAVLAIVFIFAAVRMTRWGEE